MTQRWCHQCCSFDFGKGCDHVRLKKLEQDLEDAAGELLVDIPEPGSVIAKLLLANRLLKSQEKDLKDELSRIQRLPTLDWARASAKMVQQLAQLARTGANVKPVLETFDALKTYVSKLEAKIEKLEKKEGN